MLNNFRMLIVDYITHEAIIRKNLVNHDKLYIFSRSLYQPVISYITSRHGK